MRDLATFSLFIRHLPANRGFLVASGLDDCLAFLESLRFDQSDLDYLHEALGFPTDTIEAFRGLRFTGDVWAIPEGRIVFPNEPLLEVTAPLPEAQIVETYLLNQVSFQTSIATKAARCRLAAGGADLVDFAFRRTQGIDAAIDVARCTAMVGFVATSNVEAARRFGLRATGTMAHSYVQAFPTERDAFRAFAEDFPGRTTFLVDTYDTLEGVRIAIDVIREMDLRAGLGIRLDSGDLLTLAVQARRMLDESGLPGARIVASGGLDEYDIERLVAAGAPIDAYGVGTRMGVSADAPYLDSVYKLVAYAGRPSMKLSPAKITAPGAKQVFRLASEDVLALRDEPAPDGAEPLLQPVMIRGVRTAPPTAIQAARRRFESDLACLPESALPLRDPVPRPVRISDRLRDLIERTEAELHQP
jgi:nicotinate phosphoribosyltransferase